MLASLAVALTTPALAFAQASIELCPGSNQGADCPGLIEMEVKDVIPLPQAQTHAVVLISKDHATVLPIFVDDAAAVAIAFRLAHRSGPEPLSQDLLDRMVAQLGGTVTSVRIDDVHEHLFLSHVFLRQGRKRFGLDAKPSDAVSMALAGRARIWATRTVVNESGISRQEINALKNETAWGVGGSGDDISL